MRYHSKQGFSTLIAILLTAFLIALTAGILSLFVGEWRINRTLYDSIASYSAAEGGVEYALLKSKLHDAGFQDSLDFSYDESSDFRSTRNRRAPVIGYTIEASGKNWSGTIAPSWFEIIPLSIDSGRVAKASEPNLKTPEITPITDFVHTATFLVTPSDEIVWNILSSDSHGDTDGVIGTGGTLVSFGNDARATEQMGTMKKMGSYELAEKTTNISELLNFSVYKESYLMLYNPNTASGVTYEMESPEWFSFPTLRIVGKGKVGSSTTYLELRENKSKYFDALKYSFYNK